MLISKYNYQPISRKTLEGKRHYATPDGQAVPSVTTILDATKPEKEKQALANWKKRVGTERAQQITTEAASRGTRMHKWLEDYCITGVLNEPGSNPYSQQSHRMAELVIEHGLSNAQEVWGTEVPLYYSGLYAGTTDCVGVHNSKPAIMDFKQTNKPKRTDWIESYFLQLCAYANAHNNMFDTDIKCGVILMCSKDYQYQEWILEGEAFEHYNNLWWNRVAQYYEQG